MQPNITAFNLIRYSRQEPKFRESIFSFLACVIYPEFQLVLHRPRNIGPEMPQGAAPYLSLSGDAIVTMSGTDGIQAAKA